jgi:hypothetical protein
MRDASVESVVVGGRGGARDLVPQGEELDVLGRDMRHDSRTNSSTCRKNK